MTRKQRGGKTPNSNNTPSGGKGTNKSLTPVVGPTGPSSIDHNVGVVSGWGSADDLLVSVNDDVHPRETAQNIKHALIDNKANTDNNATTFDKHSPGKLLDVNVGVPSNETEPIEARVTNHNMGSNAPATKGNQDPLVAEAKACDNRINDSVAVGHSGVRVAVEDKNSSASELPTEWIESAGVQDPNVSTPLK
jgi:hypothetical protein